MEMTEAMVAAMVIGAPNFTEYSMISGVTICVAAPEITPTIRTRINGSVQSFSPDRFVFSLMIYILHVTGKAF